jgi:hypothetical protein
MLVTNFLCDVFSQHPQLRNTRRSRCRHTDAAEIESLEDRALLSGMTFRVTNTSDTGGGSLRAAIGLANSNPGEDTVRIAQQVKGEIALTSGTEILITDDVTIRGPGASKLSVSGEGLTRVFSVIPTDPSQGINVEIRDLGITNGLATDAPGYPSIIFAFGGGIYNLGGHVTLRGVHMTGNHAGSKFVPLGAGGAIANEFGGTVEIRHSFFADNSSVGRFIGVGGAISQDIGPTPNGAGTRSPTLEISHSRFEGNSTVAVLTDPVAAGPFGPFAGFGLGGAIANLAGTATVAHTVFVGNSARSGDGVLGNPGASAIGGAIFTDDFSPFDEIPEDGLGRDAELDVSHSVFVGNMAHGGSGDEAGDGGSAYGGAIGASISFFPEAGQIDHSVFRNNSAIGGIGGPDGGAGGDATGGAVAVVAGAEFTVDHSLFTRNTARGGTGGPGASGGEGRGGAIGLNLLKTSQLTLFETFIPSASVSHSRLVSNRAVGGRGGVDGGTGGLGAGGGLGLADGATAVVSKSLVARNHAVGGRGGASGGDAGDGRGGGIYNGNSTVLLERSAVLGNAARGGKATGGGDDGLGFGGGIYNAVDGDFSIDQISLFFTRFNRADEGDDVFGDLTLM